MQIFKCVCVCVCVSVCVCVCLCECVSPLFFLTTVYNLEQEKLTLSLMSCCLWRSEVWGGNATLPSHGRVACVAATCSYIFREVTSGYGVGLVSPRVCRDESELLL